MLFDNHENIFRGTWPGAFTYLEFLREQIKDFGLSQFESILIGTEFPVPPTLDSVMDLIGLIAVSLKDRQQNQASIDEIVADLVEEHRFSGLDSTAQRNARRAVFAIISWLTMLIKPRNDPSTSDFTIFSPSKCGSHTSRQSIETARRPIIGLLRGFGSFLPIEDRKRSARTVEVSSTIHTSSVEYYTLKVLGKVTFLWVDVLSAHLEFEPQTRTVSLFRFPTFCALNCMSRNRNYCSRWYAVLPDNPAPRR